MVRLDRPPDVNEAGLNRLELGNCAGGSEKSVIG
jgi:hypothetical protein